MKKLLLFSLMLILFSSLVFGMQGDIKLLAVTEKGTGSVANLHLEITEGSGRVFIETRPLSKLDTVISTRFANTIACNFLEKDCSNYDFFYTITADSAIVGGPSAGSAIAVLTAAVLDNQKVPDDIAITGTINSGGFIGSVGAVKEKTEVASEHGIKTILIPLGDSLDRVNNTTIDLVEFGKELKIDVKEVPDLNAAMFEVTGKRYWPEFGDIEVPEVYIETMQALSKLLCNKAESLQKEILSHETKEAFLNFTDEEAINLTTKAKQAFERGSYYSAASYCYGANVAYREILLRLEDKEPELAELEQELDKFEEKIDNKHIETITDLETYMVVKERIAESREFLNRTALRLEDNDTEYYNDYAIAIERLYSARTWSEFFGKPGKRFIFNRESLRESCTNKISEAEERFHYVNTIIPFIHTSAKTELDRARSDLDRQDYVLCLFRAGKAKSETDAFINALGVEEDHLNALLENKLHIAKQNIAKQISKGIFPIVGYSYYQYSNDLVESNQYMSLLFSEYALEMSNIDIYFKEVDAKTTPLFNPPSFNLSPNTRLILMLVAGLCIGFAIGILYIRHVRRTRRRKRRSK
ncbi:hypothetical protein KY328_01835 [Candidatus Woesearchaeota archaeon]|nr:hypothetical protein [Candidatus Woesearchaeota archaeon]